MGIRVNPILAYLKSIKFQNFAAFNTKLLIGLLNLYYSSPMLLNLGDVTGTGERIKVSLIRCVCGGGLVVSRAGSQLRVYGFNSCSLKLIFKRTCLA